MEEDIDKKLYEEDLTEFKLLKSYFNYTRLKYDFKKQEFPHNPKLQLFDSTGTIIWENSTHFLSEYLDFIKESKYFQDFIAKAQFAVELGCGIGMAGIYFYTLFQIPTYLTDYHPLILQQATMNASINSCALVETMQLDWDLFSEIEKSLPTFYNRVKMIIGSDIVYSSESVLCLANTIERLLNIDGICIISHEVRHTIYNKDGLLYSEMVDTPLLEFKEICGKLGLIVSVVRKKVKAEGKMSVELIVLAISKKHNEIIESITMHEP